MIHAAMRHHPIERVTDATEMAAHRRIKAALFGHCPAPSSFTGTL
jgi:hypothetical protein